MITTAIQDIIGIIIIVIKIGGIGIDLVTNIGRVFTRDAIPRFARDGSTRCRCSLLPLDAVTPAAADGTPLLSQFVFGGSQQRQQLVVPLSELHGSFSVFPCVVFLHPTSIPEIVPSLFVCYFFYYKWILPLRTR